MTKRKEIDLSRTITKMIEAMKGSDRSDVMYLCLHMASFCCMSGTDILTEALDNWEQFNNAGRNYIKDKYGKYKDFSREVEEEKGN